MTTSPVPPSWWPGQDKDETDILVDDGLIFYENHGYIFQVAVLGYGLVRKQAAGEPPAEDTEIAIAM
jgi:hypothetical protein